jgi:hypothetical protein
VERAVSFAATLVAQRCREGGSQLLLAVSGREPTVVKGVASQALLREAMHTLAVAEAATEDHLGATLAEALNATPLDADLLVIGVRPAHLDDAARFPFWSDPHRRARREDVWSIDAGSEELDEWFEVSLDAGATLP